MTTFGNIDDYITDGDIELSGIDISIGRGRYFTIRRAGGANKEFETYLSHQMKQNKRRIKAGDEDLATSIMYDIYSKKIVIGWGGFKDDKGKDVPYTPAKCVELFEQAEDLWKVVLEESQNINNFRKEHIEEVGNV